MDTKPRNRQCSDLTKETAPRETALQGCYVVETSLREAGDHRSFDSIREAMLSVQRGTVVMTDVQNRVHHIRTTSVLEPRQKRIFDSLGMRSPFRRTHKIFHLRL